MVTDKVFITEQIAQVAHDNPRAVALEFGTHQLGYADLDQRASQFASYLSQNGVIRGDTVAICMTRSIDWIVAALGIMRSGAAYVPLDYAWPESRLRFALHDSGAKYLIGRSALLDRFNDEIAGIDPRRDAAVIEAASERVARPVDPSSIAYLIYTSGSTGVPKSVEITHANLANLTAWHTNAFGVTSEDRVSHLASLGFDAAVWEIWPNLCAGATICLIEDTTRCSPELIQQWLVAQGISISFVPTVHADALMNMQWGDSGVLRYLLTGGDRLYRLPPAGLPFEVVNNYGPTECTVVATSTILGAGLTGIPPIGQPISGSSIYLLDPQGHPVSDGTVGEIYIGGNGVANGYRNLPDLTNRCFLPDPFADSAHARMYRTGDYGVLRFDGQIEFRGRLDRQVQIRGHRVELDEIDSALMQHPNIELATAMCEGDGERDNKLVSYFLPKEDVRVPAARDLQEHLRRSLPDYMIPALFVCLRDIRQLSSEKIERSTLIHPTNSQLMETTTATASSTPTTEELLRIAQRLLKGTAVTSEDNFFLAWGHSLLGMQLVMEIHRAFGIDITLQELFEAPTMERLADVIDAKVTEKRIILIWSELLGREQIGPDDNFFDLGGHPTLVATLQERIAKELGRPVPFYQLFQNPTVRHQAQLAMRTAPSERVLPPGVFSLHPNADSPAIFWVHYLNVNLAREFTADLPLFLVTLTAADFLSLGEQPSLPSIATCLMSKILAAQPRGPYSLGGLCVGGILAYEIACQLRATGHEVSLLVLLDAPSPSYMNSYNSLAMKLSRPFSLASRNMRLGLMQSLFNARKRLIRHLVHSEDSKAAWENINRAQEMVSSAAFDYQPSKYEGNVLLLLATDSTSDVRFLPGWQKIVSSELNTQYIHGHHRELMTPQNVPSIAEIIGSYLKEAQTS